jgi:hypothetical protein
MNKNIFFSFTFFTIMAVQVFLPGAAKSQQQIVVGAGTAISVFSPINRSNDYCVYEVIYLASEINMPGEITHFAFQRVDGTDTALIQNVNIYMMHTPNSQLSPSTFDTTGYSLVYSGTFPNDSGSGWREVQFPTSFTYNGTDNLQVLVVKDYQPAVANTPVAVRWYYTNVSPSPARARRYYGNVVISNATSLSTTTFTSNVRLTFNISTGSIEIIPGNTRLYPNPVGQQLAIHNIQLPVEEAVVCDLLGQRLLTLDVKNGNEATLQADVSGLSPGIYFVRVRSEDAESVFKFIKE